MEQQHPAHPWFSLRILLALLFVVAILGMGFYLIRESILLYDPLPRTHGLTPTPTQSRSDQSIHDFTHFFQFAIPKPLSAVRLYDLPNDKSPQSVVTIGNRVWMTGSGSVIEYDRNSGQMLSYSDPKLANCDRDMVSIGKYLYAACHIDNIDDAFGHTTLLRSTWFTGRYGIVQIDPLTHSVRKVFSREDGLLNNFNFELYPDGELLWIATFNGVGRINTRTDKVDFFTTQMGFGQASHAVSFEVFPILVDTDYVWVVAGGNAESQGGIARYTKATGEWKAYGPQDIKTADYTRLDLEGRGAIKKIPGGIQIAFRDGYYNGTQSDQLVEKQYLYSTGAWTLVPGSSKPASGLGSTETAEYVDAAYQLRPSVSSIDAKGLTQLVLADGTSVQIHGRDNFALSPVINHKRYLLTNASIDVLSETAPFRTMLVSLGSRLEEYVEYGEPEQYQDLVTFGTDPQGSYALVIDSACGGQGCSGGQKAWLIDLQKAIILRTYTATDGLPNGDIFYEAKVDMLDGLMRVIDKTGKPLVGFDPKAPYAMHPLTSLPTPYPTWEQYGR